jgi:predicted RNA-binding protein with PUA-like domain
MNYWLLKSEPSAYSWDQLVKDGRTHWNGIRNHQAAANLKAMKRGDRAFFYHSNEGLAIVGICEIAREAHPDPSDASGRFVMVDIKPLEALRKPVSLAEMKSDKRFAELALIRQSRLSVVPVSHTHWRLISAMGGAKLCG